MTDPAVIREQIEQTRGNLSDDVNALADSVKPGNVAKRHVNKVRDAATSAKDKVMGATSDAGSRVMGVASDAGAQVKGVASGAGSQVGSAGSSLTETVTSAPQQIQSRTAGNPLAAGVIALGVGWLIGSLLPSTRAEQQAAVSVKETAVPLVSDVAKDATESLRGPAQEALESVKSTASDAAATVKDEGTSSVQDVKQQAVEAKDTVQDARS
jgi:hypothetical protein